jgi:hypothetical protein
LTKEAQYTIIDDKGNIMENGRFTKQARRIEESSLLWKLEIINPINLDIITVQNPQFIPRVGEKIRAFKPGTEMDVVTQVAYNYKDHRVMVTVA